MMIYELKAEDEIAGEEAKTEKEGRPGKKAEEETGRKVTLPVNKTCAIKIA